MVEIKQPDYGLTKFLEEALHKGYNVSEREVNGLTILTLDHYYDWRPSVGGTLISAHDVALSNGYFRGVRSLTNSNGTIAYVVNIPDEPMIGYYLLFDKNASFSIDLGTEILREDIKFEDIAFRSRFGITVEYILDPTLHLQGQNVGSFRTVKLGNEDTHIDADNLNRRYLFDGQQQLPHEYKGTVYNITEDESTLTLTKDNDEEHEELIFPKRISMAQVNELERILMTDIEWLNLSRSMPILQYSRTGPSSDFQPTD